ncbi:CPBP family intramembrane metalloprotease [Streptococcus cristatus]|uniref:CPBP family intramembrane metalloprotease n=1 Tax=Streptococcus cristatus TaxID=45634 RepID=A0A5B0DF31_STRCR|nr:type II CAAX endopeptidase family protein [Streptococcus cristatus]KAA0964140.1 CPBP family intramembrane metalloprotease [Streptococcus cristatus]
MTWWKRLIWVGCAFLALALYVLPMLIQQLAITYQFPKQWSLGLGILLIFLTLLVFVVVAKKAGILSQSGKIFQQGDGKRIALGLLSMLLISVLGTVLLRWLHGEVTTANQASLMEEFRRGDMISLPIMLGVLAPIAEEIIFRGIIPLKIFKGYESWGYIIGGLLFALFHGPTNIMSFVIYGGSSVILTLLAYRTRRLEVSIAVHMINNGLPAILMLLIPIFGVEV